jgi:hypothetical protein
MQSVYNPQDLLHLPPMVEAPYGHGIMEPYYGPEWGFMEPPTHVITLPRCKVCEDAGKSPQEFHSHWVRDSKEPNAKVTCPTLLSQKCNYCKKKGHTIKYCDRLKKKEQNHRGNQPAMRQQSDVRQQPVMRQQPGTGYEEGEIADDASTGTMSTMSEHDWPAVGDGRSFISTTF